MIARAARSLVLVLAGALLFACTPERAFIDRCAADSEAADRALSQGDTGEAIEHLRAIATREVPGSVSPEDARVVKQDALDRWARIVLPRDANEALRLASEGLDLGARQDVFTANLLTTRGRAREALGQDREAAEDYHRALRIEEALLRRALGGEDE